MAVLGTTPLELFRRAFENPDGKPIFGLILVDAGLPEEERARLAALPFPVTFALDPLAADAAAAARIYRDAGQEVAMLATGIPQGATAADLEQTFQALDIALPEAVAVLDRMEGGFQDDLALARQAVPIVAEQGRGLVTYDRGLNSADQVARREGAPRATIFRILDGEGESIPKMRNYLDRAAFKAAQEGRVLVIGQARAETVAAILEWTVEGRASSVALAPLSAVLETPPAP
nr:divergent polysaccharide deacetylase family protein [Rhodobacter kunshanensis]